MHPLILVVDSEPQALGAVAETLTGANYMCRCCRDAQEAIAAARETPPHLIISDVNLHGHSGLEMCEQIKEDATMADVPVMFLSKAQIPDIIRRSHTLGGVYYVRKPFDARVLLELIDRALLSPRPHSEPVGTTSKPAGTAAAVAPVTFEPISRTEGEGFPGTVSSG